jgi:hypothetical protein
MKYLFLLVFLCSFCFADCVGTGGYFTVHDQKGVLVSQHTQIYKAVEKAIEISGTIKSPDIVCSGKASSSSSLGSSSSSSSISSASSSSRSSVASSAPASSSSTQSSAASSAPAGSWVVRADFEGTLGATAVGSDAFTGATKAIISDEVPAVSGSKVAKLSIPANCGGCFGTWGGIIDFPAPLKKGDEVFIKLSVYWPNGFSYNANPWLKFLRVKTFQSDGKNGGYNDIYIPNSGDAHAYQFIYEGENVWTRFGNAANKVQFGVWETYEFYIKFDNIPAGASEPPLVKFTKNGEVLSEIRARKTLGNETYTANSFYLFTYWNGDTNPAQHVYVDDITISAKTN